MMCQYEANKIIQLLRFCSWKAHTEMNTNGLQDLSLQLKVTFDKKEKEPNEKYLLDLKRSAEKKALTGEEVTARCAYIISLLNNGGFSSWDDWKNALSATTPYIRTQAVDLDSFEDKRPVIVLSESLQKQLPQKDWQWIAKSEDLQIRLQNELPPGELIMQLFSLLDRHPFIVWMIPVAWKDDLSVQQQLSRILESGRIVPVWIHPGDPWSREATAVPNLKQRAVGGIPGVLTSVLYVEEEITEFLNPDGVEDELLGQSGPIVQNGIFNLGSGKQQNSMQQNISGGTQYFGVDKG